MNYRYEGERKTEKSEDKKKRYGGGRLNAG
jgi:hypothetical protein